MNFGGAKNINKFSCEPTKYHLQISSYYHLNLESLLNHLSVFEHTLTVETDLKHEAEQMQTDGEFVGLGQCGEFVGPVRHTHCVGGGEWRGGLHQMQTQLRNLQNTSHSVSY